MKTEELDLILEHIVPFLKLKQTSRRKRICPQKIRRKRQRSVLSLIATQNGLIEILILLIEIFNQKFYHRNIAFEGKEDSSKSIFALGQRRDMLLRSKESILLEQRQQDIIFTKLPVRLVNMILQMVSPKEVQLLRCVCKWFKEFIDSNDNLVASSVFSLFFPKQVDFFCDYGENGVFLSERAHKNYLLSFSQCQAKWKSYLKRYEGIRENLLSSLYNVFIFQNTESLSISSLQKNSQFPQLSEKLSDDNKEEKKEAKDQSDLPIKQDSLNLNAEDQIEQIDRDDSDPFFDLKQKAESYSKSQEFSHLDSPIQNDDLKRTLRAQRLSNISSKIIWGIMRDPPLPILKLRRENIGGFCNTWFQNKLAEVLWEGSNQIGLGTFAMCEEDNPLFVINSIIKENKKILIEEVKDSCQKSSHLKEQILNLRYYFYQKKIAQNHLFSRESPSISPQFRPTLKGRLSSFQLSINKSGELKEFGKSRISFSQISEHNPHELSRHAPFNFFQDVNEAGEDSESSHSPKNSDQNFFANVLNSINPQLEDVELFDEEEEEEEKEEKETEEVNRKELPQRARQDKQIPLLLQLIDIIVDLVKFKSELCFEYLKAHIQGGTEGLGGKKNGYDLLSEYNIQWRGYVALLNELEEQLKDVFEIFNEAFISIFENYPEHPHFSIWRFMAKMWIRSVYEKEELKDNLFGCFFKILSIRRQENFLFQLKQINLDSKVQKQSYMPDQLQYISFNLLNNLTKNKNFSLLNYGEGYDYQHAFFINNQYHTDSLLSSFSESILDLSLNEISIHYLGHTKIQTDTPYISLEKQLLDSSLIYYQHQQSMFSQNPSSYIDFLEGDLKYVSKIFKERSQVLLRAQMFVHWKEMFKQIITSQIPALLQEFSQKDEKTQGILIQHAKQQIVRISPQLPSQREVNQTSDQNVLQGSPETNEATERQTLPYVSGDLLSALIFDILTESEEKKQSCQFLEFKLNRQSFSTDIVQSEQLKPIEISSKPFFSNQGENEHKLSTPKLEKPQLQEPSQSPPKQTSCSSETILDFQEKAHIMAQLLRMGEEQMKLGVQSYIELCKKQSEMSIKCDQDIEIEDLNRTRRLPITLNNEEQIFFFLTRQLTESILGEIVQKQKQFLKQQQHQTSDDDESEDIYDSDNPLSNQDDTSQQDSPKLTSEKIQNTQIENDNKDKSNKGKRHRKQKKNNKSQSDIPIYNSGDESDSHSQKREISQHFVQRELMEDPQEKLDRQASSDFSFGLIKEQSHLSNHTEIKEQNESSTESPVKPKNTQQFKFQINSSEKNDFFKQEKQLSAELPQQVNMFTFKLHSNDLPLQEQEEENFFSQIVPQTSSKSQHIDLFSQLSNNSQTKASEDLNPKPIDFFNISSQTLP